MSKTKRPPTCGEFLVAAVRFFRGKRKHIEGVRLAKVYAAALEMYPDKDIRDALNGELKNETLWLAARLSENKNGKFLRRNDIRLRRVRRDYLMGDTSWKLSPEGKRIAFKTDLQKVDNYLFIRQILLYVTEDGLPKRLHKSTEAPAGTIGAQIIASMEKK